MEPERILRAPALLTDTALEAEIKAIGSHQDAERYEWTRHARASQLEPDNYHVWTILAGRGYGKTRTGSETVRKWATQAPGGHFAVLAKSNREVLNVCFEAPRAGLISVFPANEIRSFQRGFGLITLRLANGSIIRGFSSEAPDALRGYAFDGVWCDEFSAWHPATAQTCYDMLWFTMREATTPKMIVTTTPRNVAHLRNLINRSTTDPSVIVTRGSTSENAANLSQAALAELNDRYGGTRLGRQELDGELLLDIDGALFNFVWIEAARVDVPAALVRTVVAVDPAGTATKTSDETGILVVAAGTDGHDYVLADASAKVAGAAAAAAVWRTFIAYQADEVVIEGTNLWMLDVLQDAYNEAADGDILPAGQAPVVTVGTMNRSKHLRAEPIAARYEQGRVHHVGEFPMLEEQLCAWMPSTRDSPDRMDALVHGITRLRQRMSYGATISYPPRLRRVMPRPVSTAAPRTGQIVDPGVLARSAFAPPTPQRGLWQAIPRQ